MAVISRVTTWSDGQTLTASALNGEFNNILTDYNGGITNANISGSAAIAYSKLNLAASILNADLSGSIAASKISGTAAILTGNTFTGANTTNLEEIKKQIATPANPSSGFDKLYVKSDDKLYLLTSGGVESQVGSVSSDTNASNGTVATSSGTATLVTNCTVSVTTASQKNIFITASGNFHNTNATDSFFQLYRDTTALGSEVKISCGAGSPETGFSLSVVDKSVAAGAYTYSLKVRTSAGTLTVNPATICTIVS